MSKEYPNPFAEQFQPRSPYAVEGTPFASKAEQTLWKILDWLAGPDLMLLRHVRRGNENGWIELDFLLTGERRKVNIEIDGAIFHDKMKDQRRDYNILDSGWADAIYRIDSEDIWKRSRACALRIVWLEPDLFLPWRAKKLLEHEQAARAMKFIVRGEKHPEARC